MIIQPLSQRDPSLAGIKLGTSNVTIWDYGCALTDMTMLINFLSGKNYSVAGINNMLIDGKGYAEGNLMWWTKIPDIFPYLKFMWRGWNYENTSVADYVYNRKIPVIVQVDAAPIGSPRSDHYVLYIGDGKLADPWDGKIKATSFYPNPKGYILYEFDKSKLPAAPIETIEQLKQTISDLQATEKRLREEWIKKEADMRKECQNKLDEQKGQIREKIVTFSRTI